MMIDAHREITRLRKKLGRVQDVQEVVNLSQGKLSKSWLYDFLRYPKHDPGISKLETLDRVLNEME